MNTIKNLFDKIFNSNKENKYIINNEAHDNYHERLLHNTLNQINKQLKFYYLYDVISSSECIHNIYFIIINTMKQQQKYKR